MIFYRLKDTEISMEKKRYKILITGVAGFLGSHLSEKLALMGNEVIGVDTMMGGYEDNVVSSRRVDVFDPADGSWTQLQDCPSKISHVDLVEGHTGFWFAGGMKDKPDRPTKDHIVAEVWHLKSMHTNPADKFRSQSFQLGKKFTTTLPVPM